MADDRKKRKSSHPTRPAARETREAELLGEEEEQDAIFKTQMWLAHLFLGYWKHGLALLGVVLLISLVWGMWKNHYRDTQRQVQADLVKIDLDLPEPNPGYPLVSLFDLNDPEVKSSLEAGAEKAEEIAEEASGPGEAIAWIRAGQLWSFAENKERAAVAFEKANSAGAEGAIGWAAASQAAAALYEAGDVDGAAAILREAADEGEGILGEQALFELGQIYRDSGRTADSAKVFEEFTTRYPESYLRAEAAEALGEVGDGQG